MNIYTEKFDLQYDTWKTDKEKEREINFGGYQNSKLNMRVHNIESHFIPCLP